MDAIALTRRSLRRWYADAISPPSGLVAWLRWLGLLFGLMNLSVVLAVVTSTSTSTAYTAAGTLALAVLTAFLVWGVRVGSYPPPVDIAGAAALFVVGLQLGTPVRSMAVFTAILGFRALYGRDTDVWGAGALQSLAYLAAMVLPGGLPPLSVLVDIALPAGSLVLAGPLVHTVVRTLTEHERAASRAELMADAAASLLATSDAVSVAATTVESVRRLLDRDMPDGLAALLLRGDDLVVEATDGSPAAPVLGGRLPLRAVPDSARLGLAGSRPFFTYGLDMRDGALTRRLDPHGPAVLVMPLTCRNRVRGAVVVPHPDDVHAGRECRCVGDLEALGSQAALALDSAALTADVVRSETRFRSLVQNCSDVITVVDQTGTVRYLSPTVTGVLGYAPAALTGAHFDRIVHPDDVVEWRAFFRRVVKDRTRSSIACRLQHRSHGWRHAEIVGANCLAEPSVAGIVLDIRDVNERKAMEEELVHRASHDPLTALPNRTVFLERARALMAAANRPDALAMLFLDLDGFKLINDRFGHAAGDAVLQAVARSLQASIGPADLAARLSGDEFAVLIGDLREREQAGQVAERILEALSQPCVVQQQQLTIRASIGVAIGGAGVEDAEDLMHRADLAMYTAKGLGKNRVEVFEPDVGESLSGRRQLQADLQWAVLRNELEVRYQPVVRLADGRITAAEALVRWQHPVRGLLGPDTFIELAEDSDLIADVFEVVLRDACTNARSWQQSVVGGSPVSVNVNLSPSQLHSAELVDHVTRVLADTGLPSELLTLEITENVLVSDLSAACDTLATLKRLGVRIAIDDFGTGYSSLAYLSRLPIDVLKVDKIFMQGIDSRDSTALTRTIIDLGRRLGLPTVAEGVERVEQADTLRALGCSHAQGYLFSRPVSGERMGHLVAGECLPAV